MTPARLAALLLALLLPLSGCPTDPDDDDATDDDDTLDDDDTVPDDDDSASDDDDVAPDDDDVAPDDDDVAPDDDDVAPDDDDVAPDDDDVAPDDDDVAPDDDDVAPDDDDTVLPDDDDTVLPDDDDTALPDDDDTVLPDDDDTVLPDDDDTVLPDDDDDDTVLPDDDDTVLPDDDDTVLPDDDDTAPSCYEDGWEDNDVASQGAVLPNVTAPYSGGAACPSDDDWYLVFLDVNDELTFEVFFTHADGDIQVTMHDPSGAIVDSSLSATDEEVVGGYAATTAGAHQVRIWLDSETDTIPGANYDMSVTVMDGGPSTTCTDDPLEDDDIPPDATWVTPPQSWSWLASCDEDWFALTLAEGVTLSVDVTFDDAEGDLDLILYDATATVVASASSSTDDEQIVYTVPAAGDHFLGVVMTADSGSVPGNTYGISFSESGATCVDDVFYEDNDVLLDAVTVPASEQFGLISCPSDDDWYEIDLMTGDQVDLAVLFFHSDANLDLRFYDPGGSLVASSTSTSDNEQINWTAAADGAHTFQVELISDSGPSGAEYGWELEVVPVEPPCSPGDFFEPNDSISAVRVVEPTIIYALGACPSDDDWYGVMAGAGDTLAVTAFFDHPEGNVDLALYDSAGQLITSATSTTDDETISETVTSGGLHYVHVYLTSDSGSYTGNAYELSIEVL